jgi:hypothetical protein
MASAGFAACMGGECFLFDRSMEAPDVFCFSASPETVLQVCYGVDFFALVEYSDIALYRRLR